MSPRWRKIVRDLSSHRFRTMLVVLSISIGMFAVGVVLGTREVLIREFEVDHAASVPRNVSYRTDDFGDDVVRRAEAEPGVLAAQARRSLALRYRWAGSDSERTLSLEAFEDFEHIKVEKVVPVGAGHWPPGPGEVVLEA